MSCALSPIMSPHGSFDVAFSELRTLGLVVRSKGRGETRGVLLKNWFNFLCAHAIPVATDQLYPDRSMPLCMMAFADVRLFIAVAVVIPYRQRINGWWPQLNPCCRCIVGLGGVVIVYF
jgi:hypothetical protein